MPKRRPNRQKTFAEVSKLEPEDTYLDEETGFYLYLDNSPTLKTYEQMLAGFYRANEELDPIAFVLTEDGSSAFNVKDWYAVMYRGWHIRIVKGDQTPGPHQCQLWYKSGTEKKNHWIATLQLMAFFFNEEEVKAALLKAIAEKEFYLSDRERKTQLQP